MKYLSVIVWLLLGLLYYWLWSTNSNSCCGANGISQMEQGAAIDNVDDMDNVNQGLSGREGEADNFEEEANAARAIAEAEETKAVTSIESRDASGTRRLTFYFPYGSSESSYSRNTENDLSEVVSNAKASGKVVVVSGHTDSSGTEGWNMTLGKRRADQVRNKLIQLGLPANQVKSQSFGERQPIATNETEEGRRRNRRVELILE